MPRRNSKTQRRDVNAALRVDQAIRLRAALTPWRDIAAQCGYADKASAYNAVQRELDRRITTDIDAMRREEGVILTELFRAVAPLALGNPSLVIYDDDDAETKKEKRAARQPSLAAVDRAVAIRESFRRLYGIDADADALFAALQPQQRKVILMGSQQAPAAAALPAPTGAAVTREVAADASDNDDNNG